MDLTYEEVGQLFQRAIEEHGTEFSPHYAREQIGKHYLKEEELPGISDDDRNMLLRVDRACSWIGLFKGHDLYDVAKIVQHARQMFEAWAEACHYLAMHWDRLPDSSSKKTWTQSNLATLTMTIREGIKSRFDEVAEGEPILIEHELFEIMGERLLACFRFILGDEGMEEHFRRMNDVITHARKHTEIHNAMASLEGGDFPVM